MAAEAAAAAATPKTTNDKTSQVSRLLAQISRQQPQPQPQPPPQAAATSGTQPPSTRRPAGVRTKPTKQPAAAGRGKTKKAKKSVLSPQEPPVESAKQKKRPRVPPPKNIPFASSRPSLRDDPRRLLGNYGERFAVDTRPCGSGGKAGDAEGGSGAETDEPDAEEESQTEEEEEEEEEAATTLAAAGAGGEMPRPPGLLGRGVSRGGFFLTVGGSGSGSRSTSGGIGSVSGPQGRDAMGWPPAAAAGAPPAPRIVTRDNSCNSFGVGDAAANSPTELLAAAAAAPGFPPSSRAHPAPGDTSAYPAAGTPSADKKAFPASSVTPSPTFGRGGHHLQHSHQRSLETPDGASAAASSGGSNRGSGCSTADLSLDSSSSMSPPPPPPPPPPRPASPATGSAASADAGLSYSPMAMAAASMQSPEVIFSSSAAAAAAAEARRIAQEMTRPRDSTGGAFNLHNHQARACVLACSIFFCWSRLADFEVNHHPPKDGCKLQAWLRKNR